MTKTKSKRTKPYPFQRIDLKRIKRKYGYRAILGYEMGLGKTPVSLWARKKYARRGVAVVVCTATLKENWRREAVKHIREIATVLHSRTPHVQKLRPKGMYIVNYDILGAPAKGPRTWRALLKKIKPELVIVDECQNIKDESTQKTKAVKSLCAGVPKLLFLSGTPAPNRPIELYPVVKILKPKLFESKFLFGLKYCAGHIWQGRWDFTGASNTKKLNKILTKNVLIRRRKHDVLKDLPKKIRTVVPFELRKKDYAEYIHAVEEFIEWLSKLSKGRARRAAMNERLVQHGYLKRLAASMKLRFVKQWIQEFLDGTDQKLLLFGIHRKIIRPLYEHFKKDAVFIDGKVRGSKRQAAIDRFNADPKKRLFIGNMIAAGTGWNCTSASNVAFVELDYVPANHTQAEDRCHGLGRGTGDPVNIYYLIAKDTIDENICEKLQKKDRVLASILDGKRMGGLTIYDIYEDSMRTLVKLFKRKRGAA